MSITVSAALAKDTRGYGIIRISLELAREIFPHAEISETTVQGSLRDTGYFADLHKRLLLPESYEILDIYIEFYRLAWVIVVRSPDILRVDEGAELPHCTPVYGRLFNDSKRGIPYLIRIDIERHDRILRVD